MKRTHFLLQLLYLCIATGNAHAQFGLSFYPTEPGNGLRNVKEDITAIEVTPSEVASLTRDVMSETGTRASSNSLAATITGRTISTNDRIRIVSSSGDTYIVAVEKETAPDETTRATRRNATGDTRYYAVTRSDIQLRTSKVFNPVLPVAGAFIFPFRWRPQTGKFEPGVNVSVCGGVRLPSKKLDQSAFIFLIGVGTSMVPVRPADVDTAAFRLTETKSLGSLTLSLSSFFEWKQLQIGLSGGIDNLFENEQAQWKYQGKPWISFGIGAKIFTPSE